MYVIVESLHIPLGIIFWSDRSLLNNVKPKWTRLFRRISGKRSRYKKYYKNMTEIAYIVTLLWSWSYGSWIYSYLWTQCLSLLTLWVRIPFRRVVLDTTICYKVCEWLVAGGSFSSGTSVSSTNKTYRHDITEILWKVALSTINQTKPTFTQSKYKCIC